MVFDLEPFDFRSSNEAKWSALCNELLLQFYYETLITSKSVVTWSLRGRKVYKNLEHWITIAKTLDSSNNNNI